MKSIWFSVAILILISCQSSPNGEETKSLRNSIVTWADTVINLGNVYVDKPAKFAFHYRNTGSYPLIISKAKPTCGCTVLEDAGGNPCLPGYTDSLVGEIKLASGKEGVFTKSIYVMLNTESGFQVLRIKGNLYDSTNHQ